MAQLLQHQNSNGLCDKIHSGCMGGLLQYFDYHQRPHAKKSLEACSHGDAEQAGSTKRSSLYLPLTSNQHDKSCGDANLMVVKRKTGKVLRDLLLKKLFTKLHRKQKMLPVTPRLLRTFSIHHLECNDYVLSEERSAETETEVLQSQESDSSQNSEEVTLLANGIKCQVCGSVNVAKHVGQDQLVELRSHLTEKQAVLVEKLHATQEAFLEQKESVAKEIGTDDLLQSEDFIRMLELFNSHRELFMKILEDPNSVNKEVKSGKPSGSTSMDYDLQALPAYAGAEVDMLKSEPAVLNDDGIDPSSDLTTSHEMKNQMSHGTYLSNSIDATHENRKENHWIAMDGLLHKIPYGQKVPKEVLTTKLSRSASARLYRDIASDNISIPPKWDKHQSIQRSRSLTESLDQYSNLLNSISIRESKKLPETMNSVKKYSSLQDTKTLRNFERIHSNPEFRYHLSRDIQSGLFRGSLSLKESSITPLDVDETADVYGFAEPKLVETPPYMKGSRESDKSTEQICNVNASETTDKLPLVKLNEPEQSEACKVTDSTEEHGSHVQLPLKDSGAEECSFLGSGFHRIEVPEFSDLKQEGKGHIAVNKLGRIPEIDPSDEATKQNQISQLDSCFEEDIVSPSKYVVSEDSALKSLPLEELDSLPKLVNILDVDVFAGVETVESSSSNKHPDGLANSDAFQIKLDQKDEAEFNYVRDILKSGFNGSESVGTWYSRYQLGDPFLFGTVNYAFDELEAAPCCSNDTSLDHQLLSDLINEVLFEIYEKSFARSLFLHICPCVRPIPVGHHVLVEVWAKIGWHLSSQRQTTNTRESVMARDFAKSDGWLNLQWDSESVGMELEGLILDDLLDEFMPELIDS